MAASVSSLLPLPLAAPIYSTQAARKTYLVLVVKCSQTSAPVQKLESTGIPRRSANYKPPICDNQFLQSLPIAYQDEKYTKYANEMKEYARSLLLEDHEDAATSLYLIDTLQRLGLGYLFQEEIDHVLDSRVISERREDDLHYTSLRFRILRQNGRFTSQDDFTPYMDESGGFMEALKVDTRAVLSLYDASYLGMEGETLLDDARSFATGHLTQYLSRGSPDCELRRMVEHGLEIPHYRRNPKLDARWSIGEYQRNLHNNPKLLQLAKLMFNISQDEYKASIKATSRWWNNHGLATKLPFSRDRLPECFLWSLGYVSQPEYASATQGLTQVIQILTTLDDIYDIYGTVQELELFTSAVQRWDVLGVVDELPQYLRQFYVALFNFVNEVGYTTLKQQGCNVIPTLNKLWVDICKAYLAEAKWFYSKQIPSFEDYINNAWVTISIPVISSNAFFMMNDEIITQERLHLIHDYDELIQTTSLAIRLSMTSSLQMLSLKEEMPPRQSSVICTRKEYQKKMLWSI